MPPRIDITSQRLFIDQPMASGAVLPLAKEQANYLLNVLRMKGGDGLLIFNGRNGEWRATVADADRKRATLEVREQTRAQPAPSPITLCFAPLKQARLDYLVQKAVEMGAGRLIPIQTERTQVEVKNAARLQANIIEAAEQCGVLAVPELGETVRLERLPGEFAQVPPPHIVFCDEMAEIETPARALAAIVPGEEIAVVVGPEGGFSPGEREMILAWRGAIAISLGPRILRADTAVVAALAAVQMAVGDWRGIAGKGIADT